MTILGRLTEKSWETPGAQAYPEPEGYRPAATTVGVYIYMGVVAVLFLLIVAAYLMRMGFPGVMDHSTQDWRSLPEPPLIWINTAILTASSMAWEAAKRYSVQGLKAPMRLMAFAGGAIGLLFLAGQILLWRQYQDEGYYVASNPANAFFYLLTAIHGLHLSGGLVACSRALLLMNGSADLSRISCNISLCAVYWHFLLLVWVLVVGLLVVT